MLIQSKTMNTTTDKLREIVDRYRQATDDCLTDALKLADAEGRIELLYSDKSDLEILDAQTQALSVALQEIVDSNDD